MDKHLCGCRRCPLYEALTRAIAARRVLDEVMGDGWYEQNVTWVDAMKAEQHARSVWLDHVLAHHNRSFVAQAA